LERELERSEATYRSLIDNVSDVIFRLDQTGKFTFVSRQVQNLLGLQWKDVLGANVLKYVSEKDAERLRRTFLEILQGRSATMDLTLRRPDGGQVVVFVSANPITESGVIVGALGIARDVTEKRRLEAQIEESERRYRALTENAYDAILLVDPDTYAIVDVNPQAERLTGYSRSELLRMSILDLRRAEQADDVRRRVAAVMSTGGGRFEDAPLVRKDGAHVSVDTAASVYELEGRRYFQSIIRDVSPQKRMTEALNQRVLELQILSEVSDALQSTVDLQSVMGIVLTGVTAGKGLGFNRAFILSYDKVNNELRGEAGLGPQSAEEAGRIWSNLEAKGLTLSEILEEQIRSFPMHADASYEYARRFVITLDDDLNVFARAIRNRETLRVDRGAEDPHLSQEFLNLYTPHEFAIVPLVTRDDVMGVLLVDNLFTWRRIQEEDLHRLKLFANSAASAIERGRLLISLERRLHELTMINQDLKISRDRLIKTERLSAIGEVAASVAHEIRNPLTAIGGFARSIFTAMDEGDKNRRKVQVILEETDRLEHMLSALLEFTRPAVPRFVELDLNALILQTIHFMGTEVDPSRVHVRYQLDPDLPRAWADSQQIRQVLLNIVRNALQEMPKGGTLTLITTNKGDEVQMAIRDSGPGIKPEDMDKIFEAFFTTKPAGSGLGLAICAQIVRNHNGRIEAFSKPMEGATFVITLPVAQKALDSY
jgi:PAS domain S-box-containing protein